MRPRNRLLSMLIPVVLLLAACASASPAQQAPKADTRAAIQSSVATSAGSAVPTQPSNSNPAGSAGPTQSTADSLTAKLSEIAGSVLARQAQDASFTQSTLGYVLKVLGQVQTQTDGKARLDFSTGTLVRLGPNTLFTLQPSQDDKGLFVRLQLEIGRLWVILRGGSLQVETKSGVAAVLGSYMSVSYDPATGIVRITCLEGHCSLTTAGGTVEITAGQTAEVTGVNQAPHTGKMTDQDFKDWMNENPEAVAFVPVTGGGATTSSGDHRKSDSGERDRQGTGAAGTGGSDTSNTTSGGSNTGNSANTGSGGGSSGNTSSTTSSSGSGSSNACTGGTDNGIPGNGGFNNGNGNCGNDKSDHEHSDYGRGNGHGGD